MCIRDRNGTTAVITSGGQSYNAEIVVFDKKGKEIYRRSRKRQAVDVAVSPGGDRVAIASIAAENGAIKSYLEIFTFAADKDAAFTVHQCLHALEEPYKEVFSLRVFGELSFEDIGAIFGHNAAWARVTYYRAKAKLRTMLENKT